jgi:hypothetical protein
MGRYTNYDEVMIRYPLIKTWSDKQSHVESHLVYHAENQIDAMLSPAFSTPFSAAHGTVKELSQDYCKYLVLVDQDQDRAKIIFDLIAARIEKLINGEAQIVTSSGTLPQTGAGAEIWSNTKDYYPTHSMLDESAPETRVDSSMLSDLKNERL